MAAPTYTTFALDDSGDWAVPVRVISGMVAAKQRLENRFKSVLRDWFLDQRRGIPYREVVWVRNPSIPVIRGLFRRVLEQTPGVSRVTRFEISLDTRSRQVTIGPFEAIMTDGQIFRAQRDELIVGFPT